MRHNIGISKPKRETVFTFLRAQLSSQFASLCDFGVTILLAIFFPIYYVYATLIGAITGGIVNAVINYRWVFRTTDLKAIHVALKYTLVWIGSIGLNTGGTYVLTEGLRKISNLPTDIFIIPKIIVSLLVGFLWNYNLHRHFVYKNRRMKPKFFRRKKPTGRITGN
ncbi:MAG: GtrA family protein [Prevotellaceae bacterium]|jgi:putative flippase GtrA|nr:GtrA family protein [Prevotellaceae bacterium]